MEGFGYRKLIVWQEAKSLVIEVYVLTKKFPKAETFGLVSQMQRAAVSIVANIAEGWLRRSVTDKRRYMEIAQGSLLELAAELEVAEGVGYVEKVIAEQIMGKIHATNYLLDRYIKSLT